MIGFVRPRIFGDASFSGFYAFLVTSLSLEDGVLAYFMEDFCFYGTCLRHFSSFCLFMSIIDRYNVNPLCQSPGKMRSWSASIKMWWRKGPTYVSSQSRLFRTTLGRCNVNPLCQSPGKLRSWSASFKMWWRKGPTSVSSQS